MCLSNKLNQFSQSRKCFPDSIELGSIQRLYIPKNLFVVSFWVMKLVKKTSVQLAVFFLRNFVNTVCTLTRTNVLTGFVSEVAFYNR